MSNASFEKSEPLRESEKQEGSGIVVDFTFKNQYGSVIGKFNGQIENVDVPKEYGTQVDGYVELPDKTSYVIDEERSRAEETLDKIKKLWELSRELVVLDEEVENAKQDEQIALQKYNKTGDDASQTAEAMTKVKTLKDKRTIIVTTIKNLNEELKDYK